ncbi:MAG: M14 family metallopeptidase [Halieaceae bacterium]|jgi:predicted deacylase|nr:M14 family metallopeptidase [Halieaceae bacterium]
MVFSATAGRTAFPKLVLVLALLSAPFVAGRNASWQVADLSAEPGTLVSGTLKIEDRPQSPGTLIPVTLIHGAQPGPTLAVIAGIHGFEYPGITALQQLRRRVDPAQLSGRLLLVHVANPPAFFGRSIYTSPADGLNLNRLFPGNPEGSVSERIAHTLTTLVIEAADYLIDLHAGDGNERLRPYVYMPETGNAAFDATARGLAEAFLLDTIVIDRTPVTAPDAARFTDMTAWSRGIPAITTETGQLGSNDPEWVALALRGLENVLRHLGMLPGNPAPNKAVVWLEDFEVVPSPATGIFEAQVRDGYFVAEGGVLGELLDLFGEPLATVHAPFAGVVNYVIGTPPVSEGEPVAMISRLRDTGPAEPSRAAGHPGTDVSESAR